MGLMMSTNDDLKSKMIGLDKFAILHPKATLKEALDKMTKFKLGIACLVDESEKLIGVLTDGDLRRLLLTKQSPLPALLVSPAIEFGHANPVTTNESSTIEEVKKLMLAKEIWDIPVISKESKLIGLIHRHSLG